MTNYELIVEVRIHYLLEDILVEGLNEHLELRLVALLSELHLVV